MNLNEYNYMSASLELFAGVITLVMIVGCFLERKSNVKTSKLFVWCLVCHALMLFIDAPIWIMLANPSPDKVVAVKSLSFLSDMFFCAIISLYAYCLTEYISKRAKVNYAYANVITVFCGVAVLLWFINIFNEMYVTYDANGVDKNGPLYILSQVIYVLLPALTMILAIRYHKVLGWQTTWIVILYGLIPVICIPVQIIWAVTPVYLATTVSLVLVSALFHVEQAEHSADIEKELVKKELALSESNNSLVLSQIQPHFLYNSLTSIYRLCDTKPEEAKEAVSNFSKYLRGNLDSIKQTKMITFSDELKHLQAYLALEKIRYDEYLEVEYDIEESEFFIPPLTVQPLVENAVNHGISDLPDGGKVKISTRDMGDAYEITVSDNGVGFDTVAPINDGRSHVGIANVRSRLEIMCNGTLEIKSEVGIGTTAVVRIPKSKGDEKDERNSG